MQAFEVVEGEESIKNSTKKPLMLHLLFVIVLSSFISVVCASSALVFSTKYGQKQIDSKAIRLRGGDRDSKAIFT